MASIASLDINLNANSAGLRTGLDRARRSTRTFAQQVQTDLQTVRRAFSAAAVATGALVAATVGVANTAAMYEDLRTSLDAVTGSIEGGRAAFDFISTFATQTQFGITQLGTAFIKLQAAGITPTVELLTLFTDVASVTTDQLGALQAITDLYSRSVSGGLGLEDLNRLADRGIPVFRVLEEQLGLTRLEVGKFGMTAEGAAEIIAALEVGLNELFGGATIDRAGNLSTAISNTGIAFSLFSNEVGTVALPAIRRFLLTVTGLTEGGQDLATLLGGALSTAINNVTDLMILINENIGAVTTTLKILTTALSLFVGFRILGAIVRIGGAVITTLIALGTRFAALGRIIAATRRIFLPFALAFGLFVGTANASEEAVEEVAMAMDMGTASAERYSRAVEDVDLRMSRLMETSAAVIDTAVAAVTTPEVITEITSSIDQLNEGFESVGQTIQTSLRDGLQNAFRTGRFEASTFFDSITSQILNVAANALTNNILGSVFGGAGSGAGANSIGSFLGFQQGGVVPSIAGSSRDRDSVPALLTPGEIVIPTQGAGEGISINFNITGDIARQTVRTIEDRAEEVADIVANSFRQRGIA